MMQPQPKPVTRPQGPLAPQGAPQFPDIAAAIEAYLAGLPPDVQAIARQRLGTQPQHLADMLQAITSHIQDAQSGIALPFHPSLDHTHGPDGAMLPPVSVGGLGMAPGMAGKMTAALKPGKR